MVAFDSHSMTFYYYSIAIPKKSIISSKNPNEKKNINDKRKLRDEVSTERDADRMTTTISRYSYLPMNMKCPSRFLRLAALTRPLIVIPSQKQTTTRARCVLFRWSITCARVKIPRI